MLLNKYDYFIHVYTDAVAYVENTHLDLSSRDEADLYDELFPLDEVTGNGGNYYDTERECGDYLYQNMDLVVNALEEFGVDTVNLWQHREHINQFLDCLVRLSMLGEVCTCVMNDLGPKEDSDATD